MNTSLQICCIIAWPTLAYMFLYKHFDFYHNCTSLQQRINIEIQCTMYNVHTQYIKRIINDRDHIHSKWYKMIRLEPSEGGAAPKYQYRWWQNVWGWKRRDGHIPVPLRKRRDSHTTSFAEEARKSNHFLCYISLRASLVATFLIFVAFVLFSLWYSLLSPFLNSQCVIKWNLNFRCL